MTAWAALRATEREARLFARMWHAVAFTTFVAPVLLLVAMGIGLGSLIDDGQASLDGLDYIVFLTPGLLTASAVQNASGFSLWPIMAGHRWLGFHHAMVATPLTPTAVLTGHLAWMALRTSAAATVFVITGAVLGGIPSAWGVLGVPIAAMTALSFGAPLSAYAAHAEMDHAFDPIIRIVITPLFLFSGTFFPISQLPLVLEWAAKVFPLWHGVELARAATTGSATAASIVVHLAVLIAYVCGGWLVGRMTFTRRLTS